MKKKTKAEYLRIAQYFYTKNQITKPTAKKVSDALKKCASEYRPDYWRRLRIALALTATEQGYHKAAKTIALTKNPITSDPKKRNQIKKKQLRQRSVNKTDEKQLLDYLFNNKESTVFAAVTLVSYLGCRPAELEKLVFLDGQRIFIPSVKQTDNDDRGLDRIIHIEELSLFRSLRQAHELFVDSPYTNPTRYVQRRLDTLTQKLWPKRKVRPSLYSWRHQLGSDLKASNIDATEIAAIMGHRSTESVSVYGNKRSARDNRNYMKPTKKIVQFVRKVNTHRINLKNKFRRPLPTKRIQMHYKPST